MTFSLYIQYAIESLSWINGEGDYIQMSIQAFIRDQTVYKWIMLVDHINKVTLLVTTYKCMSKMQELFLKGTPTPF